MSSAVTVGRFGTRRTMGLATIRSLVESAFYGGAAGGERSSVLPWIPSSGACSVPVFVQMRSLTTLSFS